METHTTCIYGHISILALILIKMELKSWKSTHWWSYLLRSKILKLYTVQWEIISSVFGSDDNQISTRCLGNIQRTLMMSKQCPGNIFLLTGKQGLIWLAATLTNLAVYYRNLFLCSQIWPVGFGKFKYFK